MILIIVILIIVILVFFAIRTSVCFIYFFDSGVPVFFGFSCSQRPLRGVVARSALKLDIRGEVEFYFAVRFIVSSRLGWAYFDFIRFYCGFI